MSFNMFSNVKTEGGMNDKPDFKPIPEGSYVIKFLESSKRTWDGVPQISFRFDVPFKVNDDSSNMFENIKKVTGRDTFSLFSSFKIFRPIEFENVELGFEHNEKPLRALLMATKSLTAYDTDEEVQEILQIPVVPTYHAGSNGVTNSDDIVDGYVTLFNNILIDTACKADVTKFTGKTGKTYNNIRWYRTLTDMEVRMLENGSSGTGVAASGQVAEPNFKNQSTPSAVSSNPIPIETDDDIPF